MNTQQNNQPPRKKLIHKKEILTKETKPEIIDKQYISWESLVGRR